MKLSNCKEQRIADPFEKKELWESP